MWNPHKPFTLEQYQTLAMDSARLTLYSSLRPVVDGKPFTPLWWKNFEIRIFSEAGITDETVGLVERTIAKRIDEVGLTAFDIRSFGRHPSALSEIEQSLVRGQLDPDKLFAVCLTEKWRDEANNGRQHADLFITQRSFMDDKVSWGAARFKHGAMALTLHGKRQENTGFLQNVVLHETNHLLGMSFHCETFRNVAGFRYQPDCNMHYSCSGETLCPKCMEYLRCWWIQLEYEFRNGLV